MKKLLMVLLVLGTMLSARAESYSDPGLEELVCESVLEGAQELGLSPETVDRLLARDATGRPYSLIPGCPICAGVEKGLRAYRERAHSRETKSTELDSENPLERTSALGRLVRGWVGRRLERMSAEEKAAWSPRFERAAEEGRRQLKVQQAEGAEAYKLMWSCLMCDAAVRATK